MSPAAPADARNATPRRVRAIHTRLARHFGELVPPRSVDPLDELILTVLSQHTSDLNAGRAFADLKAAFPKGWASVVRAPATRVADVIRSGGLANTKAPRIQGILREVRRREGAYDLRSLTDMTDREAREYLTSLTGIGPKTAIRMIDGEMRRSPGPHLRTPLIASFLLGPDAYAARFFAAETRAAWNFVTSLLCRNRPRAASMSVFQALPPTTPCVSEPASLSVFHCVSAHLR